MPVLECETITCYTRVTEGVHSKYTPRKSFFIAIPTNPAAGNSVVLPGFHDGCSIKMYCVHYGRRTVT